MPMEVVIPIMGLTMEEGTIVEWLKSPGEAINKDEPLFLLETDKAVVEVPAPISGILGDVLVGSGQTAAVGTVAAFIDAPDEETGPTISEGSSEKTGGQKAASEPDGEQPNARHAGEAEPTRVRSSPAARRLANQRGIDLAAVPGSGPGGRIVVEDILRYADQSRNRVPDSPAAASPKARRTTAQKMVEAWQTVPMVTLFATASMDLIVQMYRQLRQAWTEEHGVELKWDAIWVKAVALALREHSVLNARWVEEDVVAQEQVNVGFAVALSSGLVTPVVHAADTMPLLQIAREVVRLAQSARSGRLSLSDMTEGTFTVTNLGSYGITAFTPIVNPPEAAVLGIGMVTEQIRLLGDRPVSGYQVQLALTFDHRVTDGAPAAQFLQSVRRCLEEPFRLLA